MRTRCIRCIWKSTNKKLATATADKLILTRFVAWLVKAFTKEFTNSCGKDCCSSPTDVLLTIILLYETPQSSFAALCSNNPTFAAMRPRSSNNLSRSGTCKCTSSVIIHKHLQIIKTRKLQLHKQAEQKRPGLTTRTLLSKWLLWERARYDMASGLNHRRAVFLLVCHLYKQSINKGWSSWMVGQLRWLYCVLLSEPPQRKQL